MSRFYHTVNGLPHGRVQIAWPLFDGRLSATPSKTSRSRVAGSMTTAAVNANEPPGIQGEDDGSQVGYALDAAFSGNHTHLWCMAKSVIHQRFVEWLIQEACTSTNTQATQRREFTGLAGTRSVYVRGGENP